ncbi:hypothetical protein PNK_0562 [Candidatus Protochlamydia naegleriophila]|uniref:Uncharacterized protein n=1 Tax=Candidatus Protochlamydia naegleriophila TaxID=389348 RepID=A0A0U5J9U1_9BACT|nr:hypothetical protein [Candidatus Protochlamydia naegleriophila]CUI16190.1 hypothetical protein PNK_0562 [Candidatus Protochlamydia naegleriophila]
MVIDAISNQIQSYYASLPSNTGAAACRSALYTFTAALLTANSWEQAQFNQPLRMGVIAALASVIHALIVPLFNRLFGHGEVRWYQEGLKLAINLTIIQAFFKTSAMLKIDCMSRLVFHKRPLYVFSSTMLSFAGDLSTLILNWTVGWKDEAFPELYKQWLRKRGVDFNARSNATFLVM